MQPGTYRLGSGAFLRCRLDASGAMRCEIELLAGDRREIDPPSETQVALLSDDPSWLVDDVLEPFGSEL